MEPNPPKYATGSKVGKLTILKYIGYGSLQDRNSHIYQVQCDCGAIVHRSQFTLTYNERQGYNTSCGCVNGKTNDHNYELISITYVGMNVPAKKPILRENTVLKVGDIINGTELLEEATFPDGLYSRAGFLVRCGCGRTLKKKAYDIKKLVAEGRPLHCKSCAQKVARKARAKTTEAIEPTDGFDYEALKRAQDWGYAPR